MRESKGKFIRVWKEDRLKNYDPRHSGGKERNITEESTAVVREPKFIIDILPIRF